MKNIILIFSFFIIIGIHSPQAAEIYKATDEEVLSFLENGFDDRWYGSYYDDSENKNHKNGYLSEKINFIYNSNEELLLHHNEKLFFSFINYGVVDEYLFSIKALFHTSPPFNFIHQHVDGESSTFSMHSSLQLKENKLTYSGNVNGELTEKITDNINYTLNDFFALFSWVKNENLKINDSILIRELGEANLSLVQYTILESKNKIINGVEKKIYKIADTSGFSFYIYSGDNKNLTLNIEFSYPIELRLEPKDKATDISYIADTFVLNSINLDESFYKNETLYKELKGKEIEGIVYLIIGDYNNSFVEATPSQHVNLKKDKWRLLYLGEHSKFSYEKITDEEKIETNNFKNKNNNLNEISMDFIKERILLEEKTLNNNEINQKINNLSDEEKIIYIAEWIADNIVYSAENEEVVDPLTILEKGKGDCTEISDLLTSLIKSIGIPAKSVGGYYGGITTGGDYSFGGHQWNEVGINGEWIPIDATMETWIEGSLSHIKTNENDTSENLEKKYKLQVRSAKLKDGTVIHFSNDGKIKYK
ncbi:MAG: transglutaminase family protein [Alphaproteobacteria bacterium]